MKTCEKISLSLVKIATALSEEQQQGLRSNRPNPLTEWLYFPSAQRQAGRAAALAEATGGEAPMNVRYPMTASALTTLGGGLAGSLLGGIAGQIVNPGGTKTENYGDVTYSYNTPSGAVPGAAIGGVGGALIASIINAALRRKNVARLMDENLGKKLDTSGMQPGSRLASLVSGIHQMGRADVVNAARKGTSRFDDNPRLRAGYIANMIPLVNYISAPLTGYGQMAEYGRSRAAFE